MWVWTDDLLADAMDMLSSASTTVAGPLHHAVHGLLGAPLAATHGTTLAEVEAVEADYDGYVRVLNLTWSAPHIAAEGNMEVDGPLIEIIGGSDSVSAQIFGEFLLSSDSAKLYGVNNFQAPINLVGTLVGGLVVPRTGVPVAADKGSSVVSG